MINVSTPGGWIHIQCPTMGRNQDSYEAMTYYNMYINIAPWAYTTGI